MQQLMHGCFYEFRIGLTGINLDRAVFVVLPVIVSEANHSHFTDVLIHDLWLFEDDAGNGHEQKMPQ